MKCRMVCILGLLTFAACGGTSGTRANNSSSLTWEQVSTSGISGPQVHHLAFNGSNQWFVAERTTGFYRSNDQGATWTAINTGIASPLGWTIAVNPQNGDLIAGTLAPANGQAGFYRSTNQGGSWTAIPTAFPFSSASAYTGPAFAPNGNIIFGGFFASAASCGTWVSSNGGQTTTTATCNPQIGGLFSVMYNSVTQDLWLGSEQYGAFRSTDNGLSWTEVSPPDQTISPGNGIKDGNVYGLAFDSAGDVLMGTQGGIWKSRKSGNGYTWTNINSTADIKALGRDGSGNLYMGHHQDPLNPTTVYRSGDGGATWQKADSGIPQGLEAKQFIVNPNDRKMYTTVVDEASGRGWIYRTTVAVQ